MDKAMTFSLLCLLLFKEITIQDQECPSIAGSKNNVTWPETATFTLSQPPCVDKNGEFLYRNCSSGQWEAEPDCVYIEETAPPNCPEDFFYSKESGNCYQSTFIIISEDKGDNVTATLINLLESDRSVSEMMVSLSNITGNAQKFSSFDVFLVGEILERLEDDIKSISLEVLAEVVDNLHLVQRETLRESQTERKSTDNILHLVDKIVVNHDYQYPVEIVKDNFMVFIYDVKTTNFSGLLLLEQDQNIRIKILDEEIKIENIAKFDNLNSAVVLSAELKYQLTQDGTKLVITVFSNDALFNEKETVPKRISKIFRIILPEIESCIGSISVLYKTDQDGYQKDCVYWNYDEILYGSWSNNQNSRTIASIIQCKYWHLAHFGLVLSDQKQKNNFWIELTTITTAFSLIGLIFTILPGLILKEWRDASHQIFLNLIIAMFLQIVVFCASLTTSHDNAILCTNLGIALQFFTISEFCWMLVIGFLQFKRFVDVLEECPQQFFAKSCLLGWVFPLIPVMSVSIFDVGSYTNDKIGLCYPSGLGLYLGMWLPISLIIGGSFVFFTYTFFIGSVLTSRNSNYSEEAIFRWRFGIFQFCMLTLGWTFGLLSQIGFGHVFQLLFYWMTTLQGFFLFVFFMVFSVNVKQFYVNSFKKCCCKYESFRAVSIKH